MSKTANFEGFHIRKWYTQIEDALANESGQLADGEPLRKIVIAAAVHNPYAGRFSENLDDLVRPSPALGKEFARRIESLAAGRAIESYGKACLVGSAGEYEHGNAFLTSVFAEPIRAALGGGKSWVPSSGKRGPINTVIDVPLAHKDALYVRSHYDTVTCLFPDAPNDDEVLVIFAFATRGRLHARLGGLKASEIVGRDGLI
ncbi:amino acid synthesis family protein [Burkholderia multivorans]|uniref:amino acid synthesis family protein n=1 Tax=Burkholderia multivorans TaxID=87883 RepID=UPI0020199C97|nr:amino acid synthesis family protein [Burkholderia multivorans]MCA8143566.1 amino acid synthesis family protein [Burkholderia multivorans]MCO1368576.1 amino acid synthesis family protein [Burkholderia multivorans]MCO1380467.1 amino acid synthesis family protein [Burkholderia multivorans]MDN8032136.1 amino acid synthesis family protein [Burkholderia multivorans]UQP21426.1 amino acid synthesis family protein [Burkholderia multivorans]